MQKRNQGRPRSKAFYGSDHHKELYGMTHWDVMSLPGIKPQAIQAKRMKLAGKAMTHARSIVEKPANVARGSAPEEEKRFDEFHNLQPTRNFVKKNLVPQIGEKYGWTQGLSRNFGALAATTNIRRQGACMEMSALTIEYLGEKRKKYSAKLDDKTLSQDDRVKYQFKSDALNEVNLMQGVDETTGDNHMWLRIGTMSETNTVSADAWGRGTEKASSEFSGREKFSFNSKNSVFTPEMMVETMELSKVLRSNKGVENALISTAKHNKGKYSGESAPSQEQHDN